MADDIVDEPRLGKVRFWLLTLDAVMIGVVTVFVEIPDDIRSVIFTTAEDLPGGVAAVGYVFLSLAGLLVFAATTSRKLLRAAHAMAAGIYTFYALAILATVLVGEVYVASSSIHIAIVAWLHFEAGVEQPRLKGDSQ